MKRINSIVLITFGLSLLLIQCKGPGKQPSDTQSVTASFYPLYFFASQIGGDKAVVTNITPAGAEPHDYDPTPRDMVKINDSKMLIINGHGLEAWADRIKDNIDTNKTKIIVATEGLGASQLTEDGYTVTDPHIWLSPTLAKQMVDKIAQGFVGADLGNKAYYLSNADKLKARLDSLDNAYRQGLANCATREFITSHNAFGYLASNYGLKQIPIAGLSPDAEPSPQQLAEIAAFAKMNHIKYIFFESLVSPKFAQTIASEVGAQTLILNPLEGLSQDEQTQGKDYFTEMRANLTNLEKALQCKP